MYAWIKNMKTRKAEVKMLHISLGGWWHPIDVVFVLTGWVMK